ncbi:hypothetical protein [Gelidibacter japonicus]|uniref:hypothetical protein n=1 Tax=Gelidibacter japonicus TaxID=1962232 RepID=UPI002AFE5301|nr:hypothetical protein [Gelidibacter japonicus]
MRENLTITLKLNRNDSLITLNEKLSECTNAVFFGINSLDKTDVLPESLRDYESSIFTNQPLIEMDFEKSQENFKIWILKKGFEDLISALIELMLSFSYIINLNEKIKKNPKMTIDGFKKLIFERDKKLTKAHFPELITKIEKSLKSPLKYKSEMLSLNKARNCLVHRNGIVQPNDFNVENGIELSWWYYNVELKRGIEKKELERLDIIDFAEDNMQMTSIKRTKFFNDREKITIRFQEFFELAHFCQTVGFDMLEKFTLAE